VPITHPTLRTTVKRRAQRGVYEHATILRILDEGLVCHMGFVADGQPFVLPTAYARIDDALYLHGSPSNRMLRAGKSGLGLCVTVTLLDGLVLARSAFHHSMNYRSVVLLGTALEVDDLEEKRAAFRALVEHVVPGRYAGVRAPTDDEIRGTLVLRLPITEGSAKIRSGPPIDDESDYGWPVWAGVIPLALRPGTPTSDPRLDPERGVPTYASAYARE
jgi:nitroimidazol reductase NimA-like FMN-containing flavoprotein (pyridoxamine 5'-phosphate oxidase superfamily)